LKILLLLIKFYIFLDKNILQVLIQKERIMVPIKIEEFAKKYVETNKDEKLKFKGL